MLSVKARRRERSIPALRTLSATRYRCDPDRTLSEVAAVEGVVAAVLLARPHERAAGVVAKERRRGTPVGIRNSVRIDLPVILDREIVERQADDAKREAVRKLKRRCRGDEDLAGYEINRGRRPDAAAIDAARDEGRLLPNLAGLHVQRHDLAGDEGGVALARNALKPGISDGCRRAPAIVARCVVAQASPPHGRQGFRIERIEGVVAASDIHPPPNDMRSGGDSDDRLALDRGRLAKGRLRPDLSAGGIDRRERAGPVTLVERLTHHRW